MSSSAEPDEATTAPAADEQVDLTSTVTLSEWNGITSIDFLRVPTNEKFVQDTLCQIRDDDPDGPVLLSLRIDAEPGSVAPPSFPGLDARVWPSLSTHDGIVRYVLNSAPLYCHVLSPHVVSVVCVARARSGKFAFRFGDNSESTSRGSVEFSFVRVCELPGCMHTPKYDDIVTSPCLKPLTSKAKSGPLQKRKTDASLRRIAETVTPIALLNQFTPGVSSYVFVYAVDIDDGLLGGDNTALFDIGETKELPWTSLFDCGLSVALSGKRGSTVLSEHCSSNLFGLSMLREESLTVESAAVSASPPVAIVGSVPKDSNANGHASTSDESDASDDDDDNDPISALTLTEPESESTPVPIPVSKTASRLGRFNPFSPRVDF